MPDISLPFIYIFIYLIALIGFNPARAATNEKDIRAKISEILNNRNQTEYGSAVRQQVMLLTPPAKLAGICVNPALIVPESRRLTGKRSVLAKCADKRFFIQIALTAEGRYWVAARHLSGGHTLTRQDIQPRTGNLAPLPAGTLFQADRIVGAMLTRPVEAGEPLVKSQLRPRWLATTGTRVEVMMAGEDFQIRAPGKAMNNAALNQPLKVRMKSGQTVTGTLIAAGVVRINSNTGL